MRSTQSRIWVAFIGAMLVVIGGWISTPTFARQQNAQDQPKVYGRNPDDDDLELLEREPFDRIYLDASNKNAVMEVMPLDPSVRVKKDSGLLVFRFLNRSDRQYQVPWRAVEKIMSRDELIMEEAEAAFNNQEFDRAFRYFIYLSRRGLSTPTLESKLNDYLFLDGNRVLKENDFPMALSIFEELYSRNQNYRRGNQRVDRIISRCYDEILGGHLAEGNFQLIRTILEGVKANYGSRLADLDTKWKKRLEERGREILQNAIDAAKGGDPKSAHEAVRRLLYAMPELPEALKIHSSVLENFPYVFVGTTQLPSQADFRSIDNWSSRRLGRMLHRGLIEFVGLSDDGGEYAFPNGMFQPVPDTNGQEYRFIIRERDEFGVPEITTAEIASKIRSMVREGSPDFYYPLAKLIHTIQIVDQSTVSFRLRYQHVRPEALLQVARQIQRLQEQSSLEGGDGIYRVVRRDDQEIWYDLNPMYSRSEDRQNPKIIERRFDDPLVASDALANGEIDILDQVYPSEIQRLKRNPKVVVRPYLLPTIHLLVPNYRSEYMKNQFFRKALLYGINRELILREVISGGREISGYTVISGPFPLGSEENDQVGYAYNDRIPPVEYSLHMGTIAPLVVQNQLRSAAERKIRKERRDEIRELAEDQIEARINQWLDADPTLKFPKLVLAHPATDIAKRASESMQQMWAQCGIEVSLRELPPGQTRPDDEDYDLLYVELTVEEPLVDTRRILGELGFATQVNATIEQLLSELDLAATWSDARETLRDLHQQCAYDLTVLPLWQVVNHYGYRTNIRQVGNELIHVYQNVGDWRIVPYEK